MTGGPREHHGERGDRCIELYVRSVQARPNATQTRTMDRLDRLVADAQVEEYEVVVWGERVPASPTDVRTTAGQFVHDRIAAFREWANSNDASLGTGFRIQEVDAAITGESYSELVLPHLVLAEFDHGRLSRVVPHVCDGEVVTVEAYLDDLATDEVPATKVVDRGPAAVPVGGAPTRVDDREREAGKETVLPPRPDPGVRTRPREGEDSPPFGPGTDRDDGSDEHRIQPP